MTPNWNRYYFKFLLSGILAKLALLTELALVAGHGDRAIAQIIPDDSLGNETSVVTPNVEIKGLPAERIDGGAIRDSNLFHSFQEFNIGDLQRVYFANPAGITNIFSRVTGSNLSEIFGTLGVNGNANLFFINPNGIIFGENASLDVGGSFVGSTANAIQFGDRGWFSATEPEQPPLLTVKPSAFFFNQIKAERIENRSTAPAGVDLSGELLSGLKVPDGQSLLLVGGDIAIDRGGLHAPGGQVELAGVAGDGTVGLNVDGNNLNLSFPEDLARADVTFTNSADLNVRAGGGGSITVNARNIELSGGEFGASNLRAGIAPDSGSTTAQAGDITLNATDTITVSQGSRILNWVEESGVGNAGGIDITTANLSLTQGSVVGASTFGQGDTGAITIEASDTISAEGSGIANQVVPTGIGNSGGINITTANLSLTQGAQISASIFEEGNAGEITINASDTISAEGEDRDGFNSGIFSTVTQFGKGKAGGINITTTNLSLTQGGLITASTFGVGDAGDIIITTANLSLTQGGVIGVNTFGVGDAGKITINASDTISAEGKDDGLDTGLLSQVAESGISSRVAESGEGNAGGIILTTTNLSLTNEAQISVDSLGQGNAGNLFIQANSIALSNRASLLASTPVGTGGNITLQIADNLILRDNSTISAQALEDANGGNITIDADFVIAFSNQNNDIIASAAQGNGGEINISTNAIFGIEERSSTPTNETNDIDASSEFGLEGEVTINQLDINPAEGLEELPTSIIDVARLINQNLCLTGQEGEFIITGKGGLSPSPKDTLNTDAGWEDWRMVVNSESNYQRSPQSSQTRSLLEENYDDSHQIIEAQSWFIAPNGNIVLSAQPVKSVSRSSSFLPPNCQLLDEVKQ